MNKIAQKFTIVFTSLVLSGFVGMFAEDKMDSRNELPTAGQIEEAAKVPAKKEDLGKTLLSVFADKNQPAKKRIECALTLGKLKYLPAIPKLIELIELQDPEAVNLEPPLIEDRYPCIRALANYGEEGVPSIVEAYAKEDNGTRQRLLRTVIRVGKTRDAAITLAKKLLSEKTDDRAKARLKALVDNLMKP